MYKQIVEISNYGNISVFVQKLLILDLYLISRYLIALIKFLELSNSKRTDLAERFPFWEHVSSSINR
jgi:hypothetical protein